MKASIDETESMGVCTRKLQEKASIEMEAIKNKTLESLKKINSLEDAKRQIEIELDRAKTCGGDVPF